MIILGCFGGNPPFKETPIYLPLGFPRTPVGIFNAKPSLAALQQHFPTMGKEMHRKGLEGKK